MHPSRSLSLFPVNFAPGNIYEIPIHSSHKHFLISPSSILLVQQSIIPTSCIINNYLSPSTRIYMFTPFDSLFLLLPSLLLRPGLFCDLEDILSDCQIDALKQVEVGVFRLERVCELKNFEGKLYVKLVPDRLKEWINSKYQRVFKEVMGRVPWADGTYDTGDNAKKVALGVLMEFLDKQTVLEIDTRYTIEMILSAGRIVNRRVPQEEHKAVVKKKPVKKEERTVPKNQGTLANFFSKKK